MGPAAIATPHTIKPHTIRAGRYAASILNFGATIADLQVAVGAGSRSVVLGLANLADYAAHMGHMGAVAGRCANRIKGGRFQLDGESFQLPLNENGRTHLHGGVTGFGRKVWNTESATDSHIELSLLSPAGQEGYPGTVSARCCYGISAQGELNIELTAVSDAPTLLNLATHSYFNLAGGGTVLDHSLMIEAGHYTPVDADLIPTGELIAVAGTPFDFRKPIKIGAARAQTPGGYDHNFALGQGEAGQVRRAARLETPSRDLAMEIWTTEPGLQFYDGQRLSSPHPLRNGPAVPFGGCCLEPQRFPNGINHPGFPNTVLRPGETYRQVTQYRFFS